MPLELDAAGMVVTRPVLGWTTAPVAEMAVILQIQYSERPADMSNGGKSIQFVLTPQQCLELAEILTTQANRVLASKASGPPS